MDGYPGIIIHLPKFAAFGQLRLPLGVVLMYLMMNVALIVQWFRHRATGEQGHWLLWLLVPVIGIIVLAIPVWGDLRPGQPSPYKYLPWLTIALIAVGVLYMLYLRVTKPDVLEHAASLLEGVEGETMPDSESLSLPAQH